MEQILHSSQSPPGSAAILAVLYFFFLQGQQLQSATQRAPEQTSTEMRGSSGSETRKKGQAADIWAQRPIRTGPTSPRTEVMKIINKKKVRFRCSPSRSVSWWVIMISGPSIQDILHDEQITQSFFTVPQGGKEKKVHHRNVGKIGSIVSAEDYTCMALLNCQFAKGDQFCCLWTQLPPRLCRLIALESVS